jgi:hypothetical protein
MMIDALQSINTQNIKLAAVSSPAIGAQSKLANKGGVWQLTQVLAGGWKCEFPAQNVLQGCWKCAGLHFAFIICN